MTIAEVCCREIEERCIAAAGGDDKIDEGGGTFLHHDEIDSIIRKMLYGYVDDPAEVDALIEMAQNAASNTILAVVMSGPRGATDALTLAHIQDIAFGIVLGRRLERDASADRV